MAENTTDDLTLAGKAIRDLLEAVSSAARTLNAAASRDTDVLSRQTEAAQQVLQFAPAALAELRQIHGKSIDSEVSGQKHRGQRGGIA